MSIFWQTFSQTYERRQPIDGIIQLMQDNIFYEAKDVKLSKKHSEEKYVYLKNYHRRMNAVLLSSAFGLIHTDNLRYPTTFF